MNIEVNIKPEDVERQVTQAILQSSLGTALQAAGKEVAKSLQNRWGSILQKHVEEEASRILLQIVRDEWGDKLREFIKAKLTDEVLLEITSAAIDVMLAKMQDTRDRRFE